MATPVWYGVAPRGWQEQEVVTTRPPNCKQEKQTPPPQGRREEYVERATQ
jgi:hypothetical protein